MPYKGKPPAMSEASWQEYKSLQPKKKAPIPWVKPQFEIDYIRRRDQALMEDMFVCEETKELIKERYKL